MNKKKALSIIETALIMSVVVVLAVVVMNKTGNSIKNLATKTTAVTVNQK